MKKWICLLLLITAVWLMCGGFAEEDNDLPIDPDFASEQSLSPQNVQEPGMLADGLQITITGNGNYDYGENTIHITVSGGTAPYKVKACLCGLKTTGIKERAYVEETHTTENVASSCDTTFDIIVPRKYIFYVIVTDADGKSRYVYGDRFEIFADPEHPTLEAMAREFLKDMPEGLTDIEKAIWIYDAVIDNCEYDETYTYHGPEHFFTMHMGVCDTYSKVMDILFAEAGIPCGRVLNSSHAWNIACINGQYFMFDATWGDGTVSKRYLYFGLTEELAKINHPYVYINELQEEAEGYKYEGVQGKCNSVQYSLFVVEGLADKWIANPCTYPGSTVKSPSLLQQTGKQIIILPGSVAMDGSTALRLYSSTKPTKEYFQVAFVRDACIYALERNGYSASRDADDWVAIDVDIPRVTELPTSVTKLETEAFADTAFLAIRVGADCQSIGSRAFADSDGLRRVYVDGDGTEIASNAFSNSPYVVLYVRSGSAAEQFAIGNGIEYVVVDGDAK